MAWENQNGKTDIKSLALTELERELAAMGEKPFRAKQLYPWLHIKHAVSFEDMTDISKKLKEKLTDERRGKKIRNPGSGS